MNKDEFIKECQLIGITIDEDKLNKLELYKKLLIEWNNKFNLTTIIEEKDIYLKHFYDSLCLIKATNLNNKKICDIGTGAGFPGMVLAIVFNNSSYILLESNQKKVSFLNEIKEQLKLSNVTIINERAETYGIKNREIFDIVTCRAVSNLKIILELSASLLKINGLFIPLKSNVEEELNNSLEKSKLLGYDLNNVLHYNLPIDNSNRTILIYRKIKSTDKRFPRKYSLIKKD